MEGNKSYLERLLSDDEIMKERDDFFYEEPEGPSFFGYFLAAFFLVGLVTVVTWSDISGPSRYDLFHQKCLKDGHTATECEFMYNQMYQ